MAERDLGIFDDLVVDDFHEAVFKYEVWIYEISCEDFSDDEVVVEGLDHSNEMILCCR